MINKIMRIIPNQQGVNFRAQLLSQWRCENPSGKYKSVSIVALEKRDLSFVSKFIEYLPKLSPMEAIRREILSSALQTLESLLDSQYSFCDKVKMFLGIHDEKPCGLLIANIPKSCNDNENIFYSSRHNSARNESELDWLVTWAPDGGEK